MQVATGERLIDQLRAELAAPPSHAPFEIDADRYRSAAWLEHERVVFAVPRIVTAASAIPAGGCLPHEGAIVVRDGAGALRAFANACRHRGTRLVDEQCTKKAIVCPYHGWTYGLDGTLLHVPHEAAFGGPQRRSLNALPFEERHGLVWLGRGLEAHLEGIADDLAALDLEHHVVYRETRSERACNWKLVIEAFLDGYHIRALHRDSIYRFFLDGASVAEPIGRHIRAVTGRRELDERETPLRERATPSWVIFPATVVIAHPDFVSIIDLRPLAPDRTDYRHLMLVPAARTHEREHWDRSWALIEETVFAREDLWVCEQVQRGLATGATDRLLFGALEHAVRWFHAALEGAMAGAG